VKKKLAIVALHPIMYQTPIFRTLQNYIKTERLDIVLTVLFLDDVSLKEKYFKEINSIYKPNVPTLLNGFNHKILKNFKIKDVGFFSRINFHLVSDLIINKYDYVLIHGYDTFSSWIVLALVKLLGIKLIFRGEAVLSGKKNVDNYKLKLKNKLIKFYLNNCDAILFSCSGNKEFILSHLNKNYTDKLFSIPCAVDNSFFQLAYENLKPQRVHLRESLGIPNNHLVILFSARFTSRKRPLDLLKSLTKIESRLITVLFVGDGPERSELEKFAISNNLNTVFVGFVNQDVISKYYTIADLKVVLSDYDPSPKAMNEAMNFELPIIVTDVVGTSKDLVYPNINGFIIKVGDVETLSLKIDYLNRNRGELIQMGEMSKTIIGNWTFKEDVKGIIKAINYLS
jgi:glycosyltransferase involved in cell wall biosynthesis